MRTPQEILNEISRQNLHKDSNRIDWDSKWLGHAYLASMRSIDARTKCGTVLVSPDNTIISEGYNGFIRGVKDSLLPNYDGHEDPTLSKYTWIPNHSETNAIINAAREGKSTKGATAYITGMPCISCIQLLWQSQISHIIIPENTKCIPKSVQTDTYKEQLELFNFLTKNAMPIIARPCNIIIEQKNI